jgi:hypothetical protein
MRKGTPSLILGPDPQKRHEVYSMALKAPSRQWIPGRLAFAIAACLAIVQLTYQPQGIAQNQAQASDSSRWRLVQVRDALTDEQ